MPPRGLALRRALHLAIAGLTVFEWANPTHGGLHVYFGYALGILLGVRLGLAVLGPPIFHVRAVLAGPLGTSATKQGGNAWLCPFNGTIALGLLVVVAAATFSGLAVLADRYGRGPLAPLMEEGPGKGIIIGVPKAFAAEATNDPPLDYGGVHSLMVASALGLGVLHIGGLALQSLASQTNLFARMNPWRREAGKPKL